MVMNAKKFQRPCDGHADRNPTDKAVRMGMSSAGDGHHSMNKKLKPGKKPPGVNGNGCRRSDLDSKLSSQGRQQSEMPSSDKKKKETDVRAQKKKAEVQRTALRVCGEWSEHVSSSGKVYYYNCRTEVSRWEKPDGWTDTSDDNGSRSKEAKKKQKPPQLTRRYNSHSAHGPTDFPDNSTTVFPSPTFSSPTFPSPTSQGAFHLRSPQTQYTASTAPDGDMPCRTFPGVMQHQMSGNPFPHPGNFPSRTNSVQIPVHPWRGPSGYYDSPVVDIGGRGRPWLPSVEEQMCLGRSVSSSDGAMYEDMDISPEGSPVFIDSRTSLDENRTDRRRSTSESSESRPSMSSSRRGSSSQAGLALSSFDGALNMTVANALTALRDFVRRTADVSAFMESENFSGLALSDFNRSLVLALDSISRLADEATSLANEPLVHQAVEMLQKLETRFVQPQHQSQLQQLSSRLLHIKNASQTKSIVSPTCSDPRRTATCAGTIESSSSAMETVETMSRRSSIHVEMTPPAINHSCDNNDLQKLQESLGNSNGDQSVPANGLCSGGATSMVLPPLMTLTPSLANYVDNQLIRHVKEWPSEVIERQAKNAADETHLMSNLHWMRVSGELKNLRSLIRTNEILTTLAEQKALFFAQQIQDLEKGHAQFVTSYDM